MRVYDADSQRAVLHVALQVEHGALGPRHGHAAQRSCEERRVIWFNKAQLIRFDSSVGIQLEL